MAGSTLRASALPTATAASAAAPQPLNTAPSRDRRTTRKPQAICDVQPLAGMDDAAVSELLQSHGMHAKREEVRFGSDAFTIRNDVTVHDACETLSRRLRELRALVILMASDPCAEPSQHAAAEACETLLDEACGLHAVVFKAVKEGGAS